MPEASATDAVIAFVRDHLGVADPIVFALGFAEGIPGLSLFVPSTALFLGIGTAHAAAGGTFWQLWLAASAGAVLGDCLTYALGRWRRCDIAGLKAFQRHPDWLVRGQALFERFGVLAIIGGKFTGFMRPFIPVAAGVAEMPIVYFLPASIVSSLAWAGAFLGPGYGLKLFFG